MTLSFAWNCQTRKTNICFMLIYTDSFLSMTSSIEHIRASVLLMLLLIHPVMNGISQPRWPIYGLFRRSRIVQAGWFIYTILYTRIYFLPLFCRPVRPSHSLYPPWILKLVGLEISGQRLISCNVKTKRISVCLFSAFFLLVFQIFERKKLWFAIILQLFLEY